MPEPTQVRMHRMPVYEEQRSNKTKRFVDADRVCTILRDWSPDVLCIEDVYSGAYGKDEDGNQRKQGVVSAFSFGEGKGILKGIAAALGYSTTKGNLLWVSPVVWKTTMGVTGDKKTSRARAQLMFPKMIFKSADEAEATLLATYGLIKMGRKLLDQNKPAGRQRL